MPDEPATMVIEEPVILADGPFPLFAVLHRPAAQREAPSIGYVFCAPFAEEKKGAHRLLVELARQCARRGVPVLRFDYRGTGDSAGIFSDFTLTGAVEDILQAVRFLKWRTAVTRAGLVGVRLGGTLAALASAQSGGSITALALWEPVTNGRRYVQMNLRQKRIREMLTAAEGGAPANAPEATPAERASTIALPSEGYDFDGYWITPQLHAEMEALVFPAPARGQAPQQVLGASVNAAGRVSRELEMLGAAYRDAGAAVTLSGIAAEPFWNLQDPIPVPELVRITADWVATSASEHSTAPAGAPVAVLNSPPEILLPSGCRERPVAFESHGRRLSGVVSVPSRDCPGGTGLVTLGGWSGTRIGPHGILTSLARRAAEAGYVALRFDFGGRGDSEGELGEASRATMIDDAVRAAGYLRECAGCRRVVFVGICAGSQVAIGAAAADARPDGLVLWSAPVSEAAEEEKAVAAKRRHFAAEYARKLFRAQTWRKLFTGKLQPRKIARVLSGEAGRAAADDRSVDLRAAAKLADFGGPLLFIYGTHDPVTSVALTYYRRILGRRLSQVTVHQVEGANHSYYGTAWREEVLACTLAWLQQHFPVE